MSLSTSSRPNVAGRGTGKGRGKEAGRFLEPAAGSVVLVRLSRARLESVDRMPGEGREGSGRLAALVASDETSTKVSQPVAAAVVASARVDSALLRYIAAGSRSIPPPAACTTASTATIARSSDAAFSNDPRTISAPSASIASVRLVSRAKARTSWPRPSNASTR